MATLACLPGGEMPSILSGQTGSSVTQTYFNLRIPVDSYPGHPWLQSE